jgi:hypothetical protein
MSTASWLDSLSLGVARQHCRLQHSRFLRAARRAAAVQEKLLHALLRRGESSGFGRDHRLGHVCGYRRFIERVPIWTFEELRPYFDRVVAGDTEALLPPGERVLMFALTSGSTDRPKHIPITSAFVREYRRGWNVFGVKALLDHPEGFLRPILQVVSPMDESRTKRGIPCGSISGLLAATAKRLVRKYYVNPAATGSIEDAEARYYTIMRFAVPGDVSWIVTANPATPLKLARSAAQHAERLIRDIHDGTITPPGEVSADVLTELRGLAKPDAATARRLSQIAARFGELRPCDYWNLAFLANWTGGTLAVHLQDFPRWFGAAPVRDIGLLATEGRVSVPLADGCAAGVLDVEGGFFEFVETQARNDDQAAVRQAHEVHVGCEYRVVMTNHAGLFRYDLEDCVRVTGFLGEAPIVEFLHRGSSVSSVTGEKLTEWQVTEAYRRASEIVGWPAGLFVLAPAWGEPPSYRLHVEVCDADANALAREMDRELGRLNREYAGKRSSGRLGAVVENVLPAGHLAAMDRQRQSRHGAAKEQFKHRFLLGDPSEDGRFPRGVSGPSNEHANQWHSQQMEMSR